MKYHLEIHHNVDAATPQEAVVAFIRELMQLTTIPVEVRRHATQRISDGYLFNTRDGWATKVET